MRLALVTAVLGLACALCAAPSPAHAKSEAAGVRTRGDITDVSAAKRKKARRAAPVYRRAPRTGPIACMRGGCNPIPAGCHIEPERTIDGTPTGFDTAVCPYR